MKIWLYLLVFIVMASSVFAGTIVTDTLGEGETKNYNLDGNSYQITIMIIEDVSPATVTFNINGKIIPQMIDGEFQVMEDTSVVKVKDIILNEAGEAGSGDVVNFMFVPGKSEFMKIDFVHVDINNFKDFWFQQGDELNLNKGDALNFSTEVNSFGQNSLSFHNVKLYADCENTDILDVPPNNIGDLPPQDFIEGTVSGIVKGNADIGTFPCALIAEGVDDFGVTRYGKMNFGIIISDGPGIGPEVCEDGLDNDFDSAADCADVLDCGGFCIVKLQDENKELKQEMRELKEQNKQFGNALSALTGKIEKLWCAFFRNC